MALLDSEPRQKRSRSIGVNLATTSAGTPGGIFMRQFWIAVARSDDLAAGVAKPIRIMGQNYTLYRGSSGKPSRSGCPLSTSRCSNASRLDRG